MTTLFLTQPFRNTLRLQHTLAYNIAPHILSSSVLTRLSSWPSPVYRNNNIPDRLVFLNTVTSLCLCVFYL